MKINYNNVNPNKLHEELVKAETVPILVENDLREGQYIAENTWITFADDVDIEKVNEIVSKHNPTPIKIQTQEDVLRAEIIKDGVTTKLQLEQQQKINANLLTQIANLTTQISKLGGTQ